MASSKKSFGVKILLYSEGKPRHYNIKEKFEKRKQARQWCRNNYWKVINDGMEITHPEKENEPFVWKELTESRDEIK